MSDWRQKLLQGFKAQTGIDPSEVIDENLSKVSTMERMQDAQLAEVGSNWPEPEDSLVLNMQLKRPKVLVKAEKTDDEDAPKIISAAPKLSELAQKILLASIPGKPGAKLGPAYSQVQGIHLPGPWTIQPVTRDLAKKLGYRFIESICKSMGIENVNRPFTRSLVDKGQHLIVVETEKTFQVWGPPIAE